MSLKDFQIATDEVMFRGGSLTLRGLSLNDFSFLMRDYLSEINNLFKLYDNAGTRETAVAQSAQFAVTVVRETPNLVAQAIVLCADEDQSMLTVAQKLPLPIQVECVRKIVALTFEESGGAKNFLDSLVGMVNAVGPTTSDQPD